MRKVLNAVAPTCRGPLRLLLLDDHPADAELARLELERSGYQVSADLTQKLEDFSARLRTNHYDLVLSDYSLGAETGMDAFSVLNHLGKDIPFILVTGTLGDELAVDCIKQGVTDVVLKENLQRLPLAVRRALAERGLRAEQELAREALVESQRQYESLVNSVDGIVWEADAKTLRFTFVSQQAERLLGYPAEQWVSQPDFWQNHIHPEDRQRAVEHCAQAVAEKRDHAFEYRMMAADNRIVWLRDMVSLVEENHQVVMLRGLMVDVTEHRELEQQFRQAQKMEAVGQLAGGVAHDFNNLLMVIRGYCELMLDRLEPQSVVRTQAEGIMQAAQRASTVTRQLLAFSRKQMLQPRVLDLNTVVGDIGTMLLRLIREDIKLELVKVPDLGRVKADSGQLEQVIVNLAVNARDAMPNGGKLTIETRNVELDNTYARHHISVQPGPYVLLAVTDNGTGMDAETRSRIFEPFFTTKEQGKGTGLGLATVYGIVKQSGGYIWVYSEPGAGTTFKIYLPRVTDAAQPERVAAVASPRAQASETVLMVEDEEGVRKVVRGFLEARGYCVLEAENGPEALRLAGGQNGPIHLLLTDTVMPLMSGPELAEQIRQQRPGIKVLFMSGYTSRGARQNHGLDAQAPFLEKPFSGETLVGKIREVLDAPPADSTAATD